MLVKFWMTKDVITIDADDSMESAIRRLKEHHIRMLPVMKEGKLVGVITDRDLKRASASDATSLGIHELLYLLSQIRVKNIMSKNPISVPQNYTIEETAELLLVNKISGAPVLDEKGKLIGIITKSDLFRVLISLTGFGARGVQFAFLVADRSGSIKELADVIRSFGCRMVSILSTYDQVPDGYRKVYIRVFGVDRTKIESLCDRLREKATLLYLVDHRENRREIFEKQAVEA